MVRQDMNYFKKYMAQDRCLKPVKYVQMKAVDGCCPYFDCNAGKCTLNFCYRKDDK